MSAPHRWLRRDRHVLKGMKEGTKCSFPFVDLFCTAPIHSARKMTFPLSFDHENRNKMWKILRSTQFKCTPCSDVVSCWIDEGTNYLGREDLPMLYVECVWNTLLKKWLKLLKKCFIVEKWNWGTQIYTKGSHPQVFFDSKLFQWYLWSVAQ